MNAVFENLVVKFVRSVVGGGPIIGTPLDELPPLPTSAVAAPVEGSAPKPLAAAISRLCMTVKGPPR